MAQESPSIDSGDTAWMIVATALVLFMTIPGLALFYGGLVRKKNVLSIFVQCFAITCLMTILWVAYGYSIAFDSTGMVEGIFNFHSLFGGLNKAFLSGITADSITGTIPETVFVIFQMTFAIITPALMIGAFAERMKFSAVMLFAAIWFTFSYLPLCHMAWGGAGALFANWGVLDFAGGTVVHINAGIAGLVACIMVGKRHGHGSVPMMPHNVPFTLIGTGMLWVGWFGFNAGSELAADGTAGMAMLVTQISSATAALVWAAIEWVRTGKPTAVGIATGAVAGLVAITPASGTAGPMGAILIGAVSGMLCYFTATSMKRRLGYDDSLDVFGVHGVGGIAGAILTGLCAAKFMGGAGIEGAGVGPQVWAQLKSVIVTIIWSGTVSVITLKIIDATMGLRTSEEDEVQGLDLSSHDETGYGW
ncbi:MAG TPA: ammonium transporter [Nitrospirae bacterium]|nr:ammonium transporter [Nitrospirota bacterium]HDN94950.1 ammonium transporter [Nitrospirota bacterium]HDO66950.1 ammonium transporter [Nitrospirota bacterium]HEW81124.1 ammonium transporter [Nitrospirota bacterium]